MKRLSLLSRGTGEFTQRQSSHQIDVKLDPQDFQNAPKRYQPAISKSDPSTTPYMPPPGFFQPRFPRLKREATLPKTYSTKKGALLLYSEEFACSRQQTVTNKANGYDIDRQQLDISTSDLTQAISRYESSQHKCTRFFTDDKGRTIKPGHSAQRHVAAWHFSHPEVNIHTSIGSRFARKPDRRGRKKIIVKASLTVFPAPYNIPKSLSQIKHGRRQDGGEGKLKERSVQVQSTRVQSDHIRTLLPPAMSSRKVPSIAITPKRKEWTRPPTPKHEPEIDNSSSASSGLKFTRARLPPIFRHPSSSGSKVIKENGSSHQNSDTSSVRKRVRIQLDPVIMPDPVIVPDRVIMPNPSLPEHDTHHGC